MCTRCPSVLWLVAMADLRIRLAAIDRRGRAAFLAGAKERSQTVEGRLLTGDEL